MSTETLVLEADAAAIERLRRLIRRCGGDEAFVRRVLAMAQRPAPPNLGDQHRVGGNGVLARFYLSEEEAAEIARRAKPLGFTRGGWIRALLRAHIRRQPQLPSRVLQETSAARYALQRVCRNLRQIARDLEGDGANEAAAAVSKAWGEGRAELIALRAAIAGNLIWWDGEDD